MSIHKVPPQARDLECAVLGSIMLEKDAFTKVSEKLSPDCFYVDANRKVFLAMRSLASRSQPIDILTVSEELKTTGDLEKIGGIYYVTRLTNDVVSSAHVEAHCAIIRKKYIRRELIRIGQEMSKEGYEDACEENQIIQEATNQLTALSDGQSSSHLKPINSVLVEQLREMEFMRHRDEALTGVPSRFFELDKLTNGWQQTDLIILAARPSKGKTAFALNLARNAAQSVPVGLFSLEMNDKQLVQRLLAREATVHLSLIRNARMSDEAMENLFKKGIQPLASTQIFIDDRAGLTIWEVRAQAKRMVEKHGCKMIIIDYLQLMVGMDEKNTKNREQEISTISRGLKGIAKELKVPVIALSQLSRDIEKRHGQHSDPQLSDLRESGAIEQDADMVLFLYGPKVSEVQEDASLTDKVLVKIAKHRNGGLETLEYNFDKPHQAFTEVGIHTGYDAVAGAAVTNGKENRWAGFLGVNGRLKPITKDEENYF